VSDARAALEARAQAILARHARPNPVADDEARRLGEPLTFDADERERLKSDPSLTHDAALANLREGLGEHFDGDAETRIRTDDGRWLDPRTGQVFDA
jgi:hypothetical protein